MNVIMSVFYIDFWGDFHWQQLNDLWHSKWCYIERVSSPSETEGDSSVS